MAADAIFMIFKNTFCFRCDKCRKTFILFIVQLAEYFFASKPIMFLRMAIVKALKILRVHFGPIIIKANSNLSIGGF